MYNIYSLKASPFPVFFCLLVRGLTRTSSRSPSWKAGRTRSRRVRGNGR